MKRSHRKFINRIINKIYAVTKSDWLRLSLLNMATRSFKNPANRIEYDKKNGWYWLKKGRKYLASTPKPYFDFSEKEMHQRCMDIFCLHCELQPGDQVVDIGAGIGTEVCFFMDAIGPGGKLYNLEASPSTFFVLEQLSSKNKFENCYNFNLAISNSNDPIWMEEGDNYIVNAVNRDAKGIRVDAVTLDQLVEEHRIDRIKLLKVNIEGAEYDMIDGMSKAINRIDNVAISCHDFLFKEGPMIREKVVGFLKENNFVLHYVDSGNKVLDSWVYGTRKES